MTGNQRVRVLYSFPHKIGADRICTTAWYQVAGLVDAGASVTAYPGVVHKSLPAEVRVQPTLARGRVRIPYRAIGRLRAFDVHDRMVARRLRSVAGEVDVVHVWPLAARRTLAAAARLGVPTVLERPNSHTRFGYEIVNAECRRLGIELPPGHEHAYRDEILQHEEEEYRMADYLLCPSDFALQTFLEQGYPRDKLLRHIYGFDPQIFFPSPATRPADRGLTALMVGVAAVGKGQHFALEAWLRSPASTTGKLLIAGEFLPQYRARLQDLLTHPSVEVLGHREDVPELMRRSDVLLLPSLSEGFGLVCVEALGSGSVPLVSDACTDLCKHMENALVHPAGDVEILSRHLTLVHEDRTLLQRLREGALASAPGATWESAGRWLLAAYREAIARKAPGGTER
jgi:glycosyltransferase involved in cell wall biosynthesis